MTLKELLQDVSKLKGWKTDPSREGPGFDVPQGSKRWQFVAADEFKDGAQAMVRFTTRIGAAEKLEAGRLRSALELNYRLPHGCLAVEGGHLVMTDTRPLAGLTTDAASTVVEFIARHADQYEKLIFQTDVH